VGSDLAEECLVCVGNEPHDVEFTKARKSPTPRPNVVVDEVAPQAKLEVGTDNQFSHLGFQAVLRRLTVRVQRT